MKESEREKKSECVKFGRNKGLHTVLQYYVSSAFFYLIGSRLFCPYTVGKAGVISLGRHESKETLWFEVRSGQHCTLHLKQVELEQNTLLR